MKICIVSIVAPRHMSMYSMYTSFFRDNNIEFDLIYLDRFKGTDKVESKNTYRLEINGSDRKTKYIGYLRFPGFAKRIIKENNYDILIIWNELTASLLSSYLKKDYKGKYIVNIRDLFDERNKLLYSMLNKGLEKSLRNSLMNTVSSEKYTDYLPADVDYVMFHSLNPDYSDKPVVRICTDRHPINIMYIGNIRFVDKLKALIRALDGDERFMLTVAGSGSEQIQEYCNSIGYNNCEFIGTFDSKKTTEIISKADILYNLYGTEYACLRTALSQKLYLSISNALPILVYNNTYMYELADKCNLAFGIDDNPIIEHKDIDRLYEWYISLDREEIMKKCDLMITQFNETNEHFRSTLKKIFCEGENK